MSKSMLAPVVPIPGLRYAARAARVETGTRCGRGGKERCEYGRAPMTEDAELILRSLTDPEQFAALFRRHAPVIHRYVTRRIGPHAADDVVAETFLAAFRQRASFRAGSPDALPWLYGIATNMLRRHWRTEVQQL